MDSEILRDPEALRRLGAGGFDAGLARALAAAGARRVLQHLELLRRQWDTSSGDRAHAAIAIGRWVELIRTGDPVAVELLTDPLLAIWAAESIRTATDDPGVERLLAPEIGGAEPFELVLFRDGRLSLPRCGGVLTWEPAAGDGRVEIRITPGAMSITTAAGETVFRCGREPATGPDTRWEPDFRIRSGTDDDLLDLAVAQHDPAAKAVGPSPVAALDARSRTRWTAAVDRAWALILERHGGYAPGIATCGRLLVPQVCDDPLRHVSSTNAEGFGAVGLSYTEDVATFAVALIHEIQHAKLSVLLDAVRLHTADDTARYYAGWRPDPRPFQALLHGVYAFSAVTEFWRVEYRAESDPELRRRYCLEYLRWAAQTSASLRELVDAGVVTGEGRAFLSGIEQVARRWDEPVEPEVRTAVSDVVAEHRINWELRRSGSAREISTGLRHAWQTRLIGTDRVPAAAPAAAHPVDIALTGGDTGVAVELAERSVRADADDLAGWFRLSRAYAHAGRPEQSEHVVAALLERTNKGRERQ